ncbi:MAG: phospho-N-acetylmuramoyl-pentapeptide-transferase [bacterium]
MLYHLLYPLHRYSQIFNVFKYISFRATYATLSALIISFLIGPWLIRSLQKYKIGQVIRDDGPQTHLKKAGTPTMGGLIILTSMIIPTLLWANLDNRYIWITLFITSFYGLIGFYDDYLKLIKKNPKGLAPKNKLIGQGILALMVGIYLYFERLDGYTTSLYIPFFKNLRINLGWVYIILAVLLIVGSSNAVNLTDGLDGLAIGPVTIAALTLAILSYVTGHSNFASYLMIQSVPGVGELTVFCGAMIGASLGFLWFNSYPAQVFMGDMGSLSLGGALGIVSLLIKHELLLAIIGGVFVVEALSVIIQVVSFKLNGKRIFRMAPLHHHFEMKGWGEPKIVVRFWIIAIMLALLSLSTLKLR